MKHRKFLSTLLSLAILLSCVGWTPSRAEEAMPELQMEQSQTAEPMESAVYTEQMSREELPEIVAQEAPLNHGHVGRLENEEQDNLNQFIFLNQDGSKTMYLYDHPVKYRDEAGNIHDISLNIADTDDTAYPFRTEANWAVTAFPRELANGITLESESAQIKMIPVLPENSTTVLNHMARRVDEDTVAYTYDIATQLEYQLTYAGFKEEIVVSEYTGQTEYHFFLYTNGLALTQLDGGYYLTDEAGNIQGTIGDIIVFTADERNNTFGQLQAETVKENGIYLLTIVLEADYLADPNTQYPIRIDPTVSLTYAESGADAIEDVLLQSGRDSLPEYGGHVIGKSSKGISRLLMRFPGIDFSALEGVTVTYAAVSLRDLLCEEEEMPITCYPFTGDAWTESTADWSVTTQAWGAALSSHIISYDYGEAQPSAFRYFFEITSLAQQWVNGTVDEDLGIILRSTDAVEGSDALLYKTFASYERASYKPTFTMTYTGVMVTPDTAEIYQGDTIDLSATTDPDGLAVTWSSGNNAIATVDENGVVTGVAPGEVTITATTANGATAHCTVTVLAKSVTVTPNSITVYKGESVSLETDTVPDDEILIWTSSNENVATVVGGVVTTLSAGQTVIRGAIDSEIYAECTVTVKTFALAQATVDVDEERTITLAVSDDLLPGYSVTWTTANAAVATVNSAGKVTGVKAGKTTVTATVAENVSASCTVYVTIADGMYYIKNASTGYTLVNSESANSSAGTYIGSQNTSTSSNTRAYQLWKIAYVDDGQYVIRPMNRLKSCLSVDSDGRVIVRDASTNDASAAATMGWTITYYDTLGYAFQYQNRVYYTMKPQEPGTATGLSVTTAGRTATTKCHWTLEKAYGIFLRNTVSLRLVQEKLVEVGDTYTKDDFQLQAEIVGNQAGGTTWSSQDEQIVSVSSYFDSMTPHHGGLTTITARATVNGIEYSATIDLLSILPLSGYELDYEPELWNDVLVHNPYIDNIYTSTSMWVKNYTNCYAYILNNQIDPCGNSFGCNGSNPGNIIQQPGQFYNMHLSVDESRIIQENFRYYPHLIAEAVQKDYHKYNEIFNTNLTFCVLESIDDPCPEDTYKVALYYNPNTLDYHWYRQNTDGTWSHKRGQTEVKCVDDSESPQLIYDPTQAATTAGYTVVLGFYAISPWNHYYVADALTIANIPSYSLSVLAPHMETKNVTFDQFDLVSLGMSMEAVMEIIGYPESDIGSGIRVHRYITVDGRTVLISYMDEYNGQYCVVNIYVEDDQNEAE